VSLRGQPIVQTVRLPDGREAVVRVGVPDDSYIPKRELDTVSLEVTVDGVHALALNTVLDADDDSAGRELAREVAAKLGSGEAEPTGRDLEALADTLR
jgi:uncharacterized protein with PhoU and TrkA domain